jgi:hypothetical protein
MSGFIPTDEEIAAMVRDLEINDPENVNPIYARQMLIKTKIMIRDLGKIYPELLDKEMEEFKKKPTDSKTDDIGD